MKKEITLIVKQENGSCSDCLFWSLNSCSANICPGGGFVWVITDIKECRLPTSPLHQTGGQNGSNELGGS